MSEGTNTWWDWTPDEWAWSPDQGRYQSEYGAPKSHVAIQLSTDGLAPTETYDYWRQMAYYDFAADPYRPDAETGPFQARAFSVISPLGQFYVCRSDAVCGRRTPRQIRLDGIDHFSLGLVLSGQRHYAEQDGTTLTSKRGHLFLYDAVRPSRLAWSAHHGVHVALPRPVVEAALGTARLPAPEASRALNRSALAPFLRGQLRLFARRAASLDKRARTLIFDQTVRLLLAVLQEVASGQPGRIDRGAYYVAAIRYIDSHLADPNLNVPEIAGAVGCSRATLYRAFAEQGLEPAGYIREARLAQAARLLQSQEYGGTIRDLALQCGFVDVDRFRNAFRRRYGMTPAEFRKAKNEDPALQDVVLTPLVSERRIAAGDLLEYPS